MKTLTILSTFGALVALALLAAILDNLWAWAGVILVAQGIVILTCGGEPRNPFLTRK